MLYSKIPPLARLFAVSCLLTLISAVPASAASIECWTNDQGVRECGNSVPPEYSQKQVEELDEHGVVVKVRPAAKTKAQLAEEARRKKEEEARKKREAEQARQDEILLSTFTSEDDIKMARDQKVKAIDGIIKVTQGSVQILQDKLQRLQKRAADIERAGKQAPQSLVTNMEDVKRQIKNKEAFIQGRRKEKASVRREYAADLKRFRELKSGKAGTVSPPGPDSSAASATANPKH